MKLIRIFLVFLFCLLPSLAFAGTTYYVDATNGGDNNSGTSMNTAWKTISRVNNHSFATGDDVYFKCGETWRGAQLDIDWSGLANDRAIIGAYYDDRGTPVFGVSGSRPIIDGGSWTVPSVQNGLVNCTNNADGYITIKDLYVKHSKYYGIFIKACGPGNLVENCYVYRPKKQGILLSKTSSSTITKCTVEEASYLTTPGGSIVITALGDEGAAQYNTVSYNLVFHGWEGINVTKKAEYTTVEYNTVYDCQKVKIYLDATKFSTVRYNLIYDSADNASWNGRNRGIQIDNENFHGYCYTGGHKVYGNLIGGNIQGIVLVNEYQRVTDSSCYQDDNLIFGNTIVDSVEFNIRTEDKGFGGWNGNEIKNNISLTLTAGSNHVKGVNTAGVTWSKNLFDENPGGYAATNAVIGDPKLLKTSGWRSLPPHNVVGTEFSIQPASAAKDKGAIINGFMQRIYNCNFTARPIIVKKATDVTPDIGAWMTLANIEYLPPPTELKINF